MLTFDKIPPHQSKVKTSDKELKTSKTMNKSKSYADQRSKTITNRVVGNLAERPDSFVRKISKLYQQ